jgi:hypothetical protein
MKMKIGIAAVALMLCSARAHEGGDHEHATAATETGNKVSITISGSQRLIVANGLPDHQPGQFPNRGNPNTISAQNHTLRVPVSPQTNTTLRPAQGWLSGVALNGVPFDPGTAEFWNGQREWNYEAIGGKLNLGLDSHNAHVQPTGAYHYHGVPNGLVANLGGDQSRMRLIGWAADGFPIYTSRAHGAAMDPKSPLKQMRSSWQLKKADRAGGPGGKPDGAFTADFEFVPGSGELDECNGRFGVTPEFPSGTYYYCVTAEFPFVTRFFKGTPDASFSKRGPGGHGNGPGSRGFRGPGRPGGAFPNGNPPPPGPQ